MKTAKIIFASAAATAIACSGAFAEQTGMGTVSRLDEASGKIAIQPSASGTVGANASGVSEEFKVQDGLLFNALREGDRVTFTTDEIGGVKTITRLQKQ
jgi:Cu/Ag efflux protein CusF